MSTRITDLSNNQVRFEAKVDVFEAKVNARFDAMDAELDALLGKK